MLYGSLVCLRVQHVMHTLNDLHLLPHQATAMQDDYSLLHTRQLHV